MIEIEFDLRIFFVRLIMSLVIVQVEVSDKYKYSQWTCGKYHKAVRRRARSLNMRVSTSRTLLLLLQSKVVMLEWQPTHEEHVEGTGTTRIGDDNDSHGRHRKHSHRSPSHDTVVNDSDDDDPDDLLAVRMFASCWESI
jgi:hypothetical protein